MTDKTCLRFLWTGVLLQLLLVTCDTHTGPDPSLGVTVYEHPDFEGSSRTFDAHAWDLEEMRGPCGGSQYEEGDWDDCISSVQVPADWEITLYRHPGYEEPSLMLDSDTRDLKDVPGPCGDDWNDCISSLQVFQR